MRMMLLWMPSNAHSFMRLLTDQNKKVLSEDYSYRPQANPRNHMEETQNTDTYTTPLMH